MILFRKFTPAVLFVLLSATAIADETHNHDHGPADLGNLGKVTFETSCKAAVRNDFSRAVAMMHSFWYIEAEKAFRAVATADPDCAMAQWGIAMSNYHPLWAPPTPDELRRGREAAARAKTLGAPTARERAFIDAINAFYADADKVDHPTRAAAYAQSMAGVASTYPDDEAAIFNALALLGTASASDKTYAKQKAAAEILTRILPRHPEHPGVAHYIIHSYDYPALAELALPAARVYAKIAPGSPHALHMPSHIFTRLGLWDESIASNRASADKARGYISRMKPGAAAFDELHAIDYLVYGHVQKGEDAKAKALVDRILAVDGQAIDNANFAAAYALAAAPARFALERRRWTDAAKLTLHPANFDWKPYPYAEANLHYARAIGAARSGDLNAAKRAIDRLAGIRQELIAQKNTYWTEQVEIQRMAAQAWLAQGADLKEEAVRLMRSAAEREDRTEKHPVTPGPIIPAREQLADMLLENGQAAEALAEIERAMTVSPRRFSGTLIAARAAEAAGEVQKAQGHYRELLALAGNAAERPELELARTFIARK